MSDTEKAQYDAAIQTNPRLGEDDYHYGIGQGSPISPLLSTILLNPDLLLKSGSKNVQYADDGILYDLSPSLIQKLESGNTNFFKPESGIEIHPKKSRFIKKDNIWQTGLKFLGLMYIGPNILPAYLDQLPAKAQDEKLDNGLLVTSEGNSVR